MNIIYLAQRETFVMRSIYVKARSKKELNARLDAGHRVLGIVYVECNEELRSLVSMPHGTVVRLRKSRVSACHASGTWDAIKQTVR